MNALGSVPDRRRQWRRMVRSALFWFALGLGAAILSYAFDLNVAARSLGFVPTHGIGAALTMVRGWTDRPPRVGFLLGPPYFPLRVAE